MFNNNQKRTINLISLKPFLSYRAFSESSRNSLFLCLDKVLFGHIEVATFWGEPSV